MAHPTIRHTVLEVVSFHAAALFVLGWATLLSGIGPIWPPAFLIVPAAGTGWLSYDARAYSVARWQTRETEVLSSWIFLTHLVPGGIVTLVLMELADGAPLAKLVAIASILAGIPLTLAGLVYAYALNGLWRALKREADPPPPPAPS